MATYDTPRLSADDLGDTQLAEYREVSRLAIAAFVLGIASPLAVVHPVLWALPAAAVVLAGAAHWRIAASDGALGGARLATVGLCLAALFGAGAVGRTVTRNWLVAREARRVVDRWLELVAADRLAEADQWRQPFFERLEPDADLDAVYAPGSERRRVVDEFFTHTPAVLLRKLAEGGRIEYVGVEQQVRRELGEESIALRYRLHSAAGDDGAPAPPQLLLIAVERQVLDGIGRVDWRITGVVRDGSRAP